MKTEEDEAFDELARKQGAWGGGFKAKQAMAADKLQEPQAMQGLAAYLRCEAGGVFVGSPNHETLMQWAREVDAARAQPAQEPLAWMCSAFDGEPCEQTNHDECENPIPLCTLPPQREWVGLTDEEIDAWTPEIHGVIRAIEQALKDKNNGT